MRRVQVWCGSAAGCEGCRSVASQGVAWVHIPPPCCGTAGAAGGARGAGGGARGAARGAGADDMGLQWRGCRGQAGVGGMVAWCQNRCQKPGCEAAGEAAPARVHRCGGPRFQLTGLARPGGGAGERHGENCETQGGGWGWGSRGQSVTRHDSCGSRKGPGDGRPLASVPMQHMVAEQAAKSSPPRTAEWCSQSGPTQPRRRSNARTPAAGWPGGAVRGRRQMVAETEKWSCPVHPSLAIDGGAHFAGASGVRRPNVAGRYPPPYDRLTPHRLSTGPRRHSPRHGDGRCGVAKCWS